MVTIPLNPLWRRSHQKRGEVRGVTKGAAVLTLHFDELVCFLVGLFLARPKPLPMLQGAF